MWRYSQSTGVLTHDGKYAASGYSGNGRGKNSPSMQDARGVGPIPRGRWRIGAPYNSANTGPLTIPVHAVDSVPTDDIHQPTGRSAFRIHGDSIRNPGTASHGCIILPRATRQRIAASSDKDLEVVE